MVLEESKWLGFEQAMYWKVQIFILYTYIQLVYDGHKQSSVDDPEWLILLCFTENGLKFRKNEFTKEFINGPGWMFLRQLICYCGGLI